MLVENSIHKVNFIDLVTFHPSIDNFTFIVHIVHDISSKCFTSLVYLNGEAYLTSCFVMHVVNFFFLNFSIFFLCCWWGCFVGFSKLLSEATSLIRIWDLKWHLHLVLWCSLWYAVYWVLPLQGQGLLHWIQLLEGLPY